MPVVSNAASDELDSPFYIQNEEICKSWEKYVKSRDGQIKGQYNAWSFNLSISLHLFLKWKINIKKATYSSGNLLLSSKHQNLQEIMKLSTVDLTNKCDNFCIRKSKIKDIFKSNKHSIDGIDKYKVFAMNKTHPFIWEIVDILHEALDNKSVYHITYINPELTIELHHKNDWFEMVNRIIQLK